MYQTIVIGGGQAGLAAGYYLRKYDIRFAILESGKEAVGSWPHYYDCLKLFSPAKYSSLPGLPFQGPPDGYPTRDEVISYLRKYKEHFDLPVITNTRVEHVERDQNLFRVTTSSGETYEAETIICATGAFHRPYIPEIPGLDGFQGNFLHSSAYRNPDTFRDQRIIVVGSGNSAVQIATELAMVSKVTLAVRTPVKFVPQKKFGRDVHFWLKFTGVDSFPFPLFGKSVPTPTSVIDSAGYEKLLASGKPDQRPMFTSVSDDGVIWRGVEKERVDTIIFATGYQPNLIFLKGLNALDERGYPIQKLGVSKTEKGLYFVGLSGQRSIASATIRGVGDDARYVVKRIKNLIVKA